MNFNDFINRLKTSSQETLDQVGNYVQESIHHIQEKVNQVQETVTPILKETAEQAYQSAEQLYASAQHYASTASQFVQEQATTIGEQVTEYVSLDEIGRKIASLGTPAIVFAAACSIAGGMGLAGGAAITTALAMVGGPFGMVGGLVALGVLTIIADAVGKYGIEAVLTATFRARQEQGATGDEICQEIDKLPLSQELKLKLKEHFSSSDEGVG